MRPSYYHFGLIGWPLEHSLSPLIHQAALDATGLSGEYRLYPLPQRPDGRIGFTALLQQVRIQELHGLNVTIPHKQAVIPYLDELSETAQAMGAVNTIYLHQGRLVGDNTDAPGFLTDLERQGWFPPSIFQENSGQPGTALILGAGGSARAIAFALSRSGWQIFIVARRRHQAQSLIQALGLSNSAAIDFPVDILALGRLPSLDLIVNTTPLGMTPNVDASPWPDDLAFPEGGTVYDLVYNPPVTQLMCQAQAAGLPATNGLGMLIEQAALAFYRWTGIDPPRRPMFASLPFVDAAAIPENIS